WKVAVWMHEYRSSRELPDVRCCRDCDPRRAGPGGGAGTGRANAFRSRACGKLGRLARHHAPGRRRVPDRQAGMARHRHYLRSSQCHQHLGHPEVLQAWEPVAQRRGGIMRAMLVDGISWVLILGGSFFTLVGALGMVRMPEVYTRMHAA